MGSGFLHASTSTDTYAGYGGLYYEFGCCAAAADPVHIHTSFYPTMMQTMTGEALVQIACCRCERFLSFDFES